MTKTAASQGNSPLEAAALELLDEAGLTALTQQLVRQPGENPPGEEAASVAALVEACTARDLDVHTVAAAPGRDNVHALTTGGDGPRLLLLGHTDVVPVGDGWTVDLFGGLLRDGRIFGRGTSDLLGGLAASVTAMDAVQRAAHQAGMPGFEISIDHPFVREIDCALRESGGPGLPPGGWTAACDGGFVSRDWGVPTVVLGSGSVNDQAHRPDESVSVDELLIAARTYVRVAVRMLAAPGPSA